MFILDFGSGNTGKNNISYMEHMVNCLSQIDPKRKFIIKWQLFKQAGDNIPLEWEAFDYIYNHAKELGYKTTASVFDLESLKFLLNYDVPFIKIANRPDLYWLIGEVPRKIPVIISWDVTKPFITGFDFTKKRVDENDPFTYKRNWNKIKNNIILCCVSHYPAYLKQYEKEFYKERENPSHHHYKQELKKGISDHTTNWDLYQKYKPVAYECHFKLEDSTGPDAGTFARTPKQLEEIYNEI
ncbi:MAG: N-acetylneuraminate synthase family protein [Melioribacteraceae bacterium]|jgi:sialic acid synthase SpsE|nr:N-acetylneuraminate synthase family protein [Melioribacteraceae bacterium]